MKIFRVKNAYFISKNQDLVSKKWYFTIDFEIKS